MSKKVFKFVVDLNKVRIQKARDRRMLKAQRRKAKQELKSYPPPSMQLPRSPAIPVSFLGLIVLEPPGSNLRLDVAAHVTPTVSPFQVLVKIKDPSKIAILPQTKITVVVHCGGTGHAEDLKGVVSGRTPEGFLEVEVEYQHAWIKYLKQLPELMVTGDVAAEAA